LNWLVNYRRADAETVTTMMIDMGSHPLSPEAALDQAASALGCDRDAVVVLDVRPAS
jgi:hypothetical protein